MRADLGQVGLLLLLVASASASAQEASPSWPRFLGPTFDGVVAEGDFRWTEEPKLLWSLPVGDGYGIGSVADGKYFHFDAAGSAPGESAERLRCVDLDDGNTVWSKTVTLQYNDLLGYEDGPRSSPTIAGDHVYTLGVAGKLTCRKVADGKVVWSVDTNEKYGVVQNFFGVGCSPLVLGNELIVMIGGSPPEDQRVAPMRLDRVSPNGSAVVAFDRATGDQRWKCGDDLASYSSPRPIEIDGETYVLVFARDSLMLIDPRLGKVRWKFDHRASMLESVNAIVPVVVGNHVLISECYEVGSALLKITPDDHEVVWKDPPRDRRAQSLRAHWSTPVVINGQLYGCSGRNSPDSDFRCIDFKTGEVKWTDPRRIRSSVTRVGDRLLVFEERGTLQVVEPQTEGLKVIAEWELDLSFPCWAAPIVVGNKLILRGTSKVLCLELTRK